MPPSASTSNTLGTGSNATSESFTYDDRGLVLTASGSAGATSYAYNGDGLTASVADAAGTTAYTFNGPNAVEWTNSSGTELIGSWNPETVTYSKNFPGPATSVTNYFAFIGGGKVREFPWGEGIRQAAW